MIITQKKNNKQTKLIEKERLTTMEKKDKNLEDKDLVEFDLTTDKNVHLYMPVYFTYKGYKKEVSSWKELYVSSISCLADEHYLNISSWSGHGDIIKSEKNLSIKSYSTISKNLYIYTDIYVFQMVEKISKFIHVCNEDDNVIKIFCKCDSKINRKKKTKPIVSAPNEIEKEKHQCKRDVFDSFLKNINIKCESNISLMTERGKTAIEISDLDEAVLQFKVCHEKIKDAKEAIIFSSNIVEKVLSNEYLYSKLLSFEIKSIDDFIEKLKLIIQEEKRNANAVIDSDDWDEAERIMNNARSNIKLIKQIVTDLDNLKPKIDVT